MIKAENRGGEVAFQAEGRALDLAQELLAIREFIKKNPEVEQMADLIEMMSNIKCKDFESAEQLEKECGMLKEDGMTLTKDVLKKAFGKKMN